ncbi:hypothetical protein BD626DRAFT_490983 [Schizophyllum amplum]|uniref:Uncharacterized protein n=1 Tax=Schizophyllum amplum TaxID=97359 RepID=A0A550CK20_9AGAR|nr:hypothetical protein BD626DRAFT_490983 [Auriculariopsis ampla]
MRSRHLKSTCRTRHLKNSKRLRGRVSRYETVGHPPTQADLLQVYHLRRLRLPPAPSRTCPRSAQSLRKIARHLMIVPASTSECVCDTRHRASLPYRSACVRRRRCAGSGKPWHSQSGGLRGNCCSRSPVGHSQMRIRWQACLWLMAIWWK